MGELIRLITLPTVWQALGRFTTGTVSVFLTLILTHNLGVINFGQFTAILTLTTIFYLPADFGLNAVFIKFASKNNESKLFFNLLFLRVIWSVILILISFFLGVILYPGNNLPVLLATATIFTTSIITTMQAFFQLKLAYFWPFIASLAGSSLTLFLVWGQSQTFLVLSTVFLAILVGQLLSALLNFGRVWYVLRFFGKTIDLELVKRYFLTGVWIGLALIFNLVYFKADILILSVLKGSVSVGFYGLAVRIFEWAILPPVFLLNSVYPVLTKAFRKDLSKFKKLSQTIAALLLFLGIIVFLGLFTFENFWVSFFGENFAQGSGTALKILATGVPIFYLTGLLMWLLIIFGKQKLLAGIYGLGAAFNIIANLIFIPKFDFLASAVITVVVESLILAASAISVFKLVKKL